MNKNSWMATVALVLFFGAIAVVWYLSPVGDGIEEGKKYRLKVPKRIIDGITYPAYECVVWGFSFNLKSEQEFNPNTRSHLVLSDWVSGSG